MKLAAVLACRNGSLRLYAKPLQCLDVKNKITILDFIIRQLRLIPVIDEIVLAISDQEENLIYRKVAKDHGIRFVMGHDTDVLGRLIKGTELLEADQVFRITTESPYCYLDNLEALYKYHCENNMDYSVTSGLPLGAYFEIIKYEALKRSWADGERKHRSELCTLYIFEHMEQFRIVRHNVPPEVKASDVRLTVDWPEDLVVMRNVYENLNLHPDTPVSVAEIIRYLRDHPKINAINNWIDSGSGRIWY